MSETKYNMVKRWIKSQIRAGTYEQNEKIHSESELMKQLSVSRHTIRLAIGELVREGWLYREQGSGTFVADRTAASSMTSDAKQKNIAIITTYISDYIFPSIIRGAESVLSQKGYQVSLFSTNNDYESERRILETIILQKFDGVIVEPTKSAASNPNISYYLKMEVLGIPYIMINANYDVLEPICVVVDDEKGAFIQTEHLIKRGHENIIGFFKTDDQQGTKRMKGYLSAHRTYGIPLKPKNIITYDTKEKANKPVELLSHILDTSQERPTGIICYNDELAMRLLDVIRQKEIQVPEEISLIGFDDSFFAEVSEVKLTTVRHPKSKMGEVAAEMIIQMIESKNLENSDNVLTSYVFEPEIVLRNSTKEKNSELAFVKNY